ncbi:MAG: ACP S-malonyltransferase, partial [Planctomycetota bacterium]
MSNPSIILCPGQGAQTVEMGKAWTEQSAEAKAVFEEANDVLGFDLATLCFEGPAEDLNRTDNAQCAIYTASTACFRALEAAGELGPIAATAGLSLGEFTALHLAGAFSFAEGLKLVRLRGEAMQDAAEASEGSMVALTGKLTEDQVNELCDKARGDGVLVPANFNTPMQIVVSGSKDACER